MHIQHLFNSSGRWIAYRRGKFLFAPSGEWIGWLPREDRFEVVTPVGHYLGTIFPPDRFYRLISRPHHFYPGSPGFPGFPGYPGFPGFGGYAIKPPGTEDVSALAS